MRRVKGSWTDFYTTNLRVRAVEGRSGINWVIEKRFMLFFWREIVRVKRKETLDDMIQLFRFRYEKTGTIKGDKKIGGKI